MRAGSTHVTGRPKIPPFFRPRYNRLRELKFLSISSFNQDNILKVYSKINDARHFDHVTLHIFYWSIDFRRVDSMIQGIAPWSLRNGKQSMGDTLHSWGSSVSYGIFIRRTWYRNRSDSVIFWPPSGLRVFLWRKMCPASCLFPKMLLPLQKSFDRLPNTHLSSPMAQRMHLECQDHHLKRWKN